VDTTVLRTEFGYTPRYSTAAALDDYAVTVRPVVSPQLGDAAATRARRLVERVGSTADAVGDRLRPAPPAPGLRAVRDA
jgi:UDP-glucose 4-epimerase